MDYAFYEIGTKKDADGEPLFLADRKVVGTVAEVKAMIQRFEVAQHEDKLRRRWQQLAGSGA